MSIVFLRIQMSSKIFIPYRTCLPENYVKERTLLHENNAETIYNEG